MSVYSSDPINNRMVVANNRLLDEPPSFSRFCFHKNLMNHLFIYIGMLLFISGLSLHNFVFGVLL